MGSIMRNPEVLVVIPSYNASNIIERALKSIAFQMYSNYEIVIVELARVLDIYFYEILKLKNLSLKMRRSESS